MEVDGAELDAQLLQQFGALGTSDRDVLVAELRALLGGQPSAETCAFFLDMNNWLGLTLKTAPAGSPVVCRFAKRYFLISFVGYRLYIIYIYKILTSAERACLQKFSATQCSPGKS